MNSRRLLLLVFASILIALAFGYVSRAVVPSILSGSAIVFRQPGAGWEALPRIPGSPADIRVTTAEGRGAVDEGFGCAPVTDRPSLAGLHWRAGMAMLALSDTAAATNHLRRGSELDPQGYYGRRAAADLKEAGVWGAAGTFLVTINGQVCTRAPDTQW